MAPKATAKPRRHKKRKSRTEVSSDSSDSEPERKQVKKSKSKGSGAQDVNEALSSSSEETTTLKTSSSEPKDADIEAAFAQFYMQRATMEFADDLEKLRTSDDFKDEAVPMLIAALKAGTAMFSMDEKKRIVLAGREKEA
ncbi:hypothetical protein WAI453_006602 [Rhynchosporium graminicola]|uniref:Ribosome assembly protein 3 n=1 Tax=Rhynchosporium graminicola TaxID=2792576 RepID=A0A1E1K3M7_9HELO|nr:uncharacterized protein RCO7_11302 [Rhynchosporium commune]